MREEIVEKYLVRRVKELGGEVRKVRWVGRSFAPDRLVMVPQHRDENLYTDAYSVWVELKAPDADMNTPRVRAQKREHERMRGYGLRVVIVASKEEVDALLRKDWANA